MFLLIAYPVQMTSFPMPANGAFDALSGATPLAAVKHGVAPDVLGVQELLLGNMPGSLGEVAALALICGFVYLLWRRVITWQIPVSVLGTMAVFAFVVASLRAVPGRCCGNSRCSMYWPAELCWARYSWRRIIRPRR